MATAINRDDHEAEKWEEEGHRHGTKVDDAGLDWREERTSEDGHDETGGTDLRIFTADSFKGDAVDSREHERHAGGTVKTACLVPTN